MEPEPQLVPQSPQHRAGLSGRSEAMVGDPTEEVQRKP
jgi:hypothetical protein